LSPVYSLAVHHQSLWLLSGLESGSINLQSVRHEKGKLITTLKQHTSAVSVLNLAKDETSVLSGSWDKNILDWDLNTGQVRRSFEGSGGQISSLEVRPASSLPVPEEVADIEQLNGTFSSNNADKPLSNGILSNGVNGPHEDQIREGSEDAPGSPADSLFGGGDSLFGDTDANMGAPSGGDFGGDDDDEFTKALELGFEQQAAAEPNDMAMADAEPSAHEDVEKEKASTPDLKQEDNVEQEVVPAPSTPVANGLPHSEEIKASQRSPNYVQDTQDAVATADSTFLSSSFDGAIRIWDRRQQNPVAKIPTRSGVPPWCMSACWSPDGNFIYAGRRNCTVEEYSLHKSLKTPERVFKFPPSSKMVTAVRPMPNGRHLLW
jgi:transcriptional activator SPT8